MLTFLLEPAAYAVGLLCSSIVTRPETGVGGGSGGEREEESRGGNFRAAGCCSSIGEGGGIFILDFYFGFISVLRVLRK